jgi:protein-tyrosine phosphatase
VTRVDLHLHLLPGVDDGAADEAAALAHAERMVAAGVRVATVTPHVGAPDFPLDPLTIADRTGELQRALDREGIALRLLPGGEIHPGALHELTVRELEAIAHGPDGARWVLAEVPFAGVDDALVAGLLALGARGFGVTIAHPERAAGLLTDGGLRRLRPVLEAGAVLQVNACSLLGRHGPEALAAGRWLIAGRLAHVVASDGHPGHRDHTLADADGALRAAGTAEAQIAGLTRCRPSALLHHGLPAAGRGVRARHARGQTPRVALPEAI